MQQPFVKSHGHRKGTDTCNGTRSQDHKGAKMIQGVQQRQEEWILGGIQVQQLLNCYPQKGELMLLLMFSSSGFSDGFSVVADFVVGASVISVGADDIVVSRST